jgi:hypothetical protein
MSTLPPELDAFASILDAQPETARGAFQYCLCLLMVEAGKMRLVEKVPSKGAWRGSHRALGAETQQ